MPFSVRKPQDRPSITFPEEGLTEQHHLEDVLIRNILLQYRETGVIKHVNRFQGTYGDFISAPDFKEAQDAIAHAKSMFETVPAHIREQFDNLPERFLDFMQNPDNAEDIEALGLDASHLQTDPEDQREGPKQARGRKRSSKKGEGTGKADSPSSGLVGAAGEAHEATASPDGETE